MIFDCKVRISVLWSLDFSLRVADAASDLLKVDERVVLSLWRRAIFSRSLVSFFFWSETVWERI